MRKFFVLLTVVAVLAVAALPSFAQDDPGTIVEIAEANGNFTTLLTAVEAAGLTETLNSEGPFTVFAPTDDAFAALPEGTIEAVLADQELLTSILLYHVVDGQAYAADVVELDSVTTLQGSDISITIEDGNVFLNDTVQVVLTDIQASNGVIHVIDGVLLPSAEEEEESYAYVSVAHFSPDTPAVDIYINGELSDIQGLEFPSVTDWLAIPAGTYNIAVAPAGTSLDSAAIGPADLEFATDTWYVVAAIGSLADGTLAPAIIAEDLAELEEGNARVTVFHAIEDAPAVDVQLADGTVLIDALGYPGTMGDGLFSLDVPAGTYDLQVTPDGANDTILFDLAGTELAGDTYYVVAAVGTLDEEDSADPQIVVIVADPSALMDDMSDDMGTIVDIATANGNFTTLLTAIEAAGLVDTLNSEGPFTVFAPTDDAFAALPEGTIEAVLADNDLLTSILLYHVVAGKVLAADVVGLESATTVQGSDISISIDEDGNVILNGTVMVIVTDIEASNGVIHVIDGVLLPAAE